MKLNNFLCIRAAILSATIMTMLFNSSKPYCQPSNIPRSKTIIELKLASINACAMLVGSTSVDRLLSEKWASRKIFVRDSAHCSKLQQIVRQMRPIDVGPYKDFFVRDARIGVEILYNDLTKDTIGIESQCMAVEIGHRIFFPTTELLLFISTIQIENGVQPDVFCCLGCINCDRKPTKQALVILQTIAKRTLKEKK